MPAPARPQGPVDVFARSMVLAGLAMLGSRLLFDIEPNPMTLLGSSTLIVLAVDRWKRRSRNTLSATRPDTRRHEHAITPGSERSGTERAKW